MSRCQHWWEPNAHHKMTSSVTCLVFNPCIMFRVNLTRFELLEIPVNLWFYWHFVTFSHLEPWTCMQCEDKVHTNNFLIILMSVGQFDSLFFFVPRQLNRPKLNVFLGYMLCWCFTTLEREQMSFSSLFSVLTETFSDTDGKSELSFLLSMYMKYYLTYLFLQEMWLFLI